MIEGCILVILTEFRTGGDAFLVIQCFWGEKTNNNTKKMMIMNSANKNSIKRIKD